jgi:hypothetical protein
MRPYPRRTILYLGAAVSLGAFASPGTQELNRPAERIYFSALNKEEKPVLGLKVADFELRIDGKVSPLQDFRPGLPSSDRSVPLAAWLLIGIGQNIQGKVIVAQANAAAASFQKFHPDSVMGIKLVSNMSETMSPLAHDPKALRGAFMQYSQRRAELDVGLKNESVFLGEGGMARAIDLAADELNAYIAAQPALRGRELHRAVMIITAGDLVPFSRLKQLYAKLARQNVFLYPVFVPAAISSSWVEDFFDLAKKTAGVASVEGALRPGSKTWPFPRSNQAENALEVNFIHLARDINGKYSFTVPPQPEGREVHLDLKCRVKGIEIRLPRATY